MRLFGGKNKELEMNREIFSLLDAINFYASQNQLTHLSKSASVIKHKIKDDEPGKKTLKQIKEMLKGLQTSSGSMNFSLAQNAIEKINKLLSGVDTSTSKESKAIDQNSQMIAQLSDEIFNLSSELVYIAARKVEAIKNNLKNNWIEFDLKEKTLKNKLSIKQKSLEQLMIKNSSIDTKLAIDEADVINQSLYSQSALINQNELESKVERGNIIQNEVKEENRFIENLIVSGISEQSDFDKARENYLIESKNEDINSINPINLSDKE